MCMRAFALAALVFGFEHVYAHASVLVHASTFYVSMIHEGRCVCTRVI